MLLLVDDMLAARASPPSLPFETDSSDHAETPAEAYADIAPLLRQARSESMAAFGSPVVFWRSTFPGSATSKCR